jgi:hypothetical protein
MGLCKHKHHRRAKQQQHKTVLFDGFIFVNSFSMMIGLMLFFDCILVDGRSLFVGLVKTDLNWFNNNSAFPFR